MENIIYHNATSKTSDKKFDVLNYSDIKEKFPNEWILLANPIYDNSQIIKGIILYRSMDKREVCYKGRDKTSGYNKIVIVYTGTISSQRKIGIMKKTI